MLEINQEVERGILFIRLGGNLTKKTFSALGDEINYLLYTHGFSNFVFDFSNLTKMDDAIFLIIQSKLVEIFLNCGKVVLSGLSELNRKKIGYTRGKLFYVDHSLEAFKYLYV